MRAPRPVLFLDFDYVIAERDGDPQRSAVSRLIPAALARLDRLVALAQPRVVASSTWRQVEVPDPAATLSAWLREAGSATEVEGVTPVHPLPAWTAEAAAEARPREIREWLLLHARAGARWCALDDWEMPELAGHLVVVRGGQLSDEDVQDALAVLRPLGEDEVRVLRAADRDPRLWKLRLALNPPLLRLLPVLAARGLLQARGRGLHRSFPLTPAGEAVLA